MRQFSAGKLAIQSDYSGSTSPLTLTANCPEGYALQIETIRIRNHTLSNSPLNNLFGLCFPRYYFIERLDNQGNVLNSQKYVMPDNGERVWTDDVDVIRISEINDISNLVDTSLRVRFDGKNSGEGQLILLQFECINPANAPYVKYSRER